MYLYSKHIYFPNQIKREGYLEIKEGIITGFHKEIEDKEFVDYGEYHLVPGFIDQHLHGWATGSYMNQRDERAVMEMKKYLPYAGVTGFLATSGADNLDNICEGIKICDKIVKEQKEDGATLLGVHLEGPFINKKRKGMQREEYCINPDFDIMKRFLRCATEKNLIRLMTIAPELEGSLEVIKLCKEENVQLSIGHSEASFETISEMKEHGLGGVTHMFSGMSGLQHRNLGVAGTALYYDDLYCEFAKQTGMTVLFEAFHIAYRVKGPDRIIMTTDNGGLAQTTQERYHYVRKQTFIPDGDELIVRNEDGSEYRLNRTKFEDVKDLELSYIKSIQNLVKNVHPSIHDVMKMTSENPAKYLSVYDRKGSLEVGKDADILVVDPQFNLYATYCMGKKYVYEEDFNV